MANVKITDLTELAAIDVATNDVLPIVDINNDSTKKVTIESLTTAVAAANDYATFVSLNANINLVQDNVAAISVGTASTPKVSGIRLISDSLKRGSTTAP